MAGTEVNGPALRWFRAGLTIAAVIAVVLALVGTTDELAQVAIPGPARLAGAGAFFAVGLVASTRAWVSLLPGVGLTAALPGYSIAQLAKYVPGSIWQGVGQIADAHRLGISAGSASVAYLVQMALQLLVAAAGSVLALAMPGLPWWLMVPAGAGPLTLLLIRRRALDGLLGWFARHSRRLRTADLHLPAQEALVAAAAASLATILAVGAGFAVLLPADVGVVGAVGTAGVFILAWAVGFLVVPLPAGLGVREAVLVLGLTAIHPVADVLAASLAARFVLLVVESGYAGIGQLIRLRQNGTAGWR